MLLLCPKNNDSCIGCRYLYERKYVDCCHAAPDMIVPLIKILTTREWEDYRDKKRKLLLSK